MYRRLYVILMCNENSVRIERDWSFLKKTYIQRVHKYIFLTVCVTDDIDYML